MIDCEVVDPLNIETFALQTDCTRGLAALFYIKMILYLKCQAVGIAISYAQETKTPHIDAFKPHNMGFVIWGIPCYFSVNMGFVIWGFLCLIWGAFL